METFKVIHQYRLCCQEVAGAIPERANKATWEFLCPRCAGSLC